MFSLIAEPTFLKPTAVSTTSMFNFSATLFNKLLEPTVLTSTPSWCLLFFKCIINIAMISSGNTHLPVSSITPNLSPSPSFAKPIEFFVALTFSIKSLMYGGFGSGIFPPKFLSWFMLKLLYLILNSSNNLSKYPIVAE